MAPIVDNQGFPYKPLEPGAFPLRIFQPLAGKDSEPLSCTLENYTDAPEAGWTCLSYVWGTEPATREITINGAPFRVRSNVYGFLRDARRQRLANLWIDSICINQSDVDERNAQVELMREIYNKAKHVMVLLDHSSPTLESAIRRLDDSFAPDTTSIGVTSGQAVFRHMTSAECTSLFEACSAAIWTRRWVKQEILMPRSAILCCGQASVGVFVFLAAIDALIDYSSLHTHAMTCLQSCTSSKEGISEPQQGETESCFFKWHRLDERKQHCANVLALYSSRRSKQNQLPMLLDRFKDSACTDFHDCVYAFRGLMDQGLSLRVDYNSSKAQMFLEVLDFVATTTHPKLDGAHSAERDFLVTLYQGLNMTNSDIKAIFTSHYHSYLVQLGYSFEMARKDVSVWVFVDSIKNAHEFAVSSWREEELQGQCGYIVDDRSMHEHHTVLNQLCPDEDMTERGVRFGGLRSWCGPDLSSLRALYTPRLVYGCSPERVEMIGELDSKGCALMGMAFAPVSEKRVLMDWLDEVKNHLVVTITDRDDAALQEEVLIVPGCESEECLLRRRH
ncbi:heterokaryon incompatibility protein-domain-containing protein [Stachybotrys elegans]|uniref:Heterokaryon incompatibility protein-domain-containing protein n=1 Tax=Stachybotrys elegans TaxID=80388 RepID=A0A8K0SQF5_9HYPO|nr:heterokaryon incompatibility protein-domain-containing protein [Stachybotrys elegans]